MYASGEYSVGENADAYDDDDPAALTDFHSTLDSYGSWVDDGTYGTVWVPASATVGADFTPYTTAGHWVYDDDWVWVSDYPWGWAPFHYGRWVLIEGRGWAWIPGRVYRGAWVAWAVDTDYAYIGWAPLGPTFVWFGGRPVYWHHYIGPRWVYCSHDVVFSERIGTRVVTGPGAASFSGRMHAYVSATPSVGGPPPNRLGMRAEQIPHSTGGATGSVSHAVAFSRPSTAQPMGASAPSRSFATAHPTGPAGARVGAPQNQTIPAGRPFVQPTPQRGATVSPPSQGRSGPPNMARPVPATAAPAPVPARPSVGPRPIAPAAPAVRSSGGGGHHR